MDSREYLRVFESVRFGRTGTKARHEGEIYKGMCASEVSDYLLGIESDSEEEIWEEQYQYEDEELEEDLLSSIQDLRRSFQLLEEDENYPKEDYWKKRSVETMFRGIDTIKSTEMKEGMSLKQSVEIMMNGKDEVNSDDEDGVDVVPKNEKKEEKKKIEAQKKCFICLDDFEPDADIVKLNSCCHKFCRECLNDYICFKSNDAACLYHHIHLIYKEKKMVVRIDEMNAYGIPCPALNCKHVMLINELVPVATTAAIDRFLRFSEIHKQNLIEIAKLPDENADPNCPRCQCPRKVKRIKNGRLRCLTCKIPFCGKCMQDHHNFRPCGFEHRLEDDMYGAARGKALRCPHCKSPIEKIDGCQFMTCRCSGTFCFLCGGKLNHSEHYSHFYDAPFGFKCKGRNKR